MAGIVPRAEGANMSDMGCTTRPGIPHGPHETSPPPPPHLALRNSYSSTLSKHSTHTCLMVAHVCWLHASRMLQHGRGVGVTELQCCMSVHIGAYVFVLASKAAAPCMANGSCTSQEHAHEYLNNSQPASPSMADKPKPFVGPLPQAHAHRCRPHPPTCCPWCPHGDSPNPGRHSCSTSGSGQI